MSIVLVPWKLMLFWGMGVEFKGKMMSNYSKEMGSQQGITTGIGFCVYVLSYLDCMYINSVVVNLALIQLSYSGLAEISSVVYQGRFKDRRGRMSCLYCFG